jgi:hypothetical protein
MIYQLIHHTTADHRTIGYFPKKKAFRMLRALAQVHGSENLSLIAARNPKKEKSLDATERCMET